MEDLIKREDALKALNDCIDIKGYAYASMHDALMEIPAVDIDISKREDYDNMKSLEEILEKELKKEMSRITTAGTLNPTDVKTLTDAVCLMLKLKEYEQWMDEGNSSSNSYRSYNPYNNMNNMVNSRSYTMPYGMRYSGHSTRDRMVSALEDIMGEAKNEYEANMIRDAIAFVQNGR